MESKAVVLPNNAEVEGDHDSDAACDKRPASLETITWGGDVAWWWAATQQEHHSSSGPATHGLSQSKVLF